MTASPIDPALLRLRARIINERLKALSGVLANGGLSLVAGGLGLVWVSGSNLLHWLLVFGGVITILTGIGLLDFMRPEE